MDLAQATAIIEEALPGTEAMLDATEWLIQHGHGATFDRIITAREHEAEAARARRQYLHRENSAGRFLSRGWLGCVAVRGHTRELAIAKEFTHNGR